MPVPGWVYGASMGLQALGSLFGARQQDRQADRQWRLAQERLNLERMEAGRRDEERIRAQRRREAIGRRVSPILASLAQTGYGESAAPIDIEALLRAGGGSGTSVLEERRVNGPGSRGNPGGVASHLLRKRY